jgi:hypothetical protein
VQCRESATLWLFVWSVCGLGWSLGQNYIISNLKYFAHNIALQLYSRVGRRRPAGTSETKTGKAPKAKAGI